MVSAVKVRIESKKENYTKIKELLEKSGFEITNDATLVIRDEDYSQDSFLGEKDGEYEIIPYSQVLYIESYGRDVYLNTTQTFYKLKNRLYEVEEILQTHRFIRISKSVIIAKSGIKRIKPTFNGRFELLMKNKQTVSVSKNYQKTFRSFIGL